MDQCEDREERVPPSKTTLCGEPERRRPGPGPGPGPGCVSLKSDRSVDNHADFKRRVPSDPQVDQQSSDVPSGRSAQQDKTQLDSIFMLLEDNVVTFVKNELKKVQKVLNADYPECLESQWEDEEVLEGEDEEQKRSSREALMKITVYFLRRMKQENLAERLQSSKRISLKEPLFSQLHQQQMEDRDVPTSSSADHMTTETGEGAETSRNPDLESHEEDDDENLDSALSDKTEDSDDWKESRASESSGITVTTSWSCSECEKKYVHKRSLRRHMMGHLRSESPSCLVDEKSFRVKKHVEPHGQVQKIQKSFGCDNCGKIFSNKSKLNTHMRIHTGEKPFVCDVCGKKFTVKSTLKKHMMIHTGEKLHVCDVCGQKCSQKQHLNSHMIIHTKQKLFECDICKKRFGHKSSLNRHMTIHREQKPVVCDVCGKRFRYKGQLNTHMRVHTGEKPFECDICRKRFRVKGHLNTHMMIHRGLKPFVCNLCGKRFRHRGSFNSHRRTHPGGQTV